MKQFVDMNLPPGLIEDVGDLVIATEINCDIVTSLIMKEINSQNLNCAAEMKKRRHVIWSGREAAEVNVLRKVGIIHNGLVVEVDS